MTRTLLAVVLGLVAVGCGPSPDDRPASLASPVAPLADTMAAASSNGGGRPAAIDTVDEVVDRGVLVRTSPVPPAAPGGPGWPDPTPESRAAADAFWTAFQAAVRARDRAATEAAFADTVRFGIDYAVPRGGEDVQRVIDGLLESGPYRSAILSHDAIDYHSPTQGAIEVGVREPSGGGVVHTFGFVEVAPGDWRIVGLATQGSP